MIRKPLALANWKMSMTITESLAFVRDLQNRLGSLLEKIDVIICPPYTILYPLAQAVRGTRIMLGGQNIAPTNDPSRTGDISSHLLVDAGCQWVMLGHWEVRRNYQDTNATINHKIHLALEANLKPIIFVGESANVASPTSLEQQLTGMLYDCSLEQVSKIIFVYEPEYAIGKETPISPQQIDYGCKVIRDWFHAAWNKEVAEQIRIIYGGSVIPEYAPELLNCVDGLGTTRRGRDSAVFANIVRSILQTKRPSSLYGGTSS